MQAGTDARGCYLKRSFLCEFWPCVHTQMQFYITENRPFGNSFQGEDSSWLVA